MSGGFIDINGSIGRGGMDSRTANSVASSFFSMFNWANSFDVGMKNVIEALIAAARAHSTGVAGGFNTYIPENRANIDAREAEQMAHQFGNMDSENRMNYMRNLPQFNQPAAQGGFNDDDIQRFLAQMGAGGLP